MAKSMLEPRLDLVPARPPAFGLSFSAGSGVEGPGSPLGVLGFGLARPDGLPQGCPFAALDIPPLGPPGVCEVLTVEGAVSYDAENGVAMACTPEILFGVMQGEAEGVALDEAARGLYDGLFTLLKRRGYPHLLRLWNYFPRITAEAGGLERYRQFTLGRYEAFAAHGRAVETAPAACALGSRSGPLIVAFLAAKTPGRPLENPRQLSAYRYPERYGPRSPSFSRALLARIGGQPLLFISGTASIVGHESRHPGDPRAQAQEAMANVETMLSEAHKAGLPEGGRLFLKIYVRHPAMLEAIRGPVLDRLKPEDQAVFLEAEICRPELLVEIDGVYI